MNTYNLISPTTQMLRTQYNKDQSRVACVKTTHQLRGVEVVTFTFPVKDQQCVIKYFISATKVTRIDRALKMVVAR